MSDKKAKVPTRRNRMRGWFVQCLADPSKRWQFSMHPQIYHPCQYCQADVHHEPLPRTKHSVRQAEWQYKNTGEIESRLDAVCLNPEPYFLSES